MNKLLVIILGSLPLICLSQYGCEGFKTNAENELSRLNPDYTYVLSQLNSYRRCNKSNEKYVERKILDVYDSIVKQRNNAIALTILADSARRYAEKQKEIANQQRDIARIQRDSLKHTLSNSDFVLSNNLIDKKESESAIARLVRSLRTLPSNVGAFATLYSMLTFNSYPIESDEKIKVGYKIEKAAFSNDDKYVLLVSDTIALLYNLQEKRLIKKITQFTCYIKSAVFSTNSRRVLIASGYEGSLWQHQAYGEVCEFDASTGEPLFEKKTIAGMLWSAIYSPSENSFATASAFKPQIWECKTGKLQISSLSYSEDDSTKTDNAFASLQYSPDGKKLLTIYGLLGRGYAQILDTKTWKRIGNQIFNEYGYSLGKFSPDGEKFMLCSPAPMREFFELSRIKFGFGEVYNTESLEKLDINIQHRNLIESVDFSPDGESIVTGSIDNRASIWDINSGKHMADLEHNAPVNSVAFNKDGLTLITASSDHTLRIWFRTGEKLDEIAAHNANVIEAKYNRTYDKVYTVTNNGEIHTWDPSKRGMLPDLISGSSSFAKFIPNTSTVLLQTEKTNDFVNKAGFKILKFDGNEKVADISLNRRYLLIIRGNDLIIRDGSGKRKDVIHHYANNINQASFSADNKLVLVARDDSLASIWNFNAARASQLNLAHDAPVYSAVFNGDGSIVATASTNKIQLWNARTGVKMGKPIATNYSFAPTLTDNGEKKYTPDDIVDIKFCGSDDAMLITFGSVGLTILAPQIRDKFLSDGYQILDLKEKLIKTTLIHSKDISSCNLTPDRKYVITTSWDKTAIIWNATSGKPSSKPLINDDVVSNSTISPNGKFLLTYGQSTNCFIWDIKRGEQHGLPLEHDGSIKLAIFSPNSKIIATYSVTGIIRLWDVLTNQLISDKIRVDTTLLGMSIDSSGNFLLTVDKSGEVESWNIVTDTKNTSLVNTCIVIAEVNIKRKLTELGYEIPIDVDAEFESLINSKDKLDVQSQKLIDWLYEPIENHKISPNSESLLSAYIKKLLETKDLASLISARLMMPSHYKILEELANEGQEQGYGKYARLWLSLYTTIINDNK